MSRLATTLLAAAWAASALAQGAAGLPGVPAPPQKIEGVTFKEAVRRASIQSTSAIIAADEIRRSQALLAEVRSSSLPLVAANASYTQLDAPRGPISSPFIPQGAMNANVGVQLPLVAPSRWVGWAHASEQVDVAHANEADVRRTTVLVAARAYLAIVAQKRVIDVSRSAREIAQARYEFAHARRAGGIGNAVDEFRAQQQLATAEAQLTNGEVGLVRAQEALGVITASEGPLDAVEEPVFEATPVADAVASAQALRLDVKAARARAVAAGHVARDSWVEWLPTILASAQAFYDAPPAITTPRTGWQVQFVLSVPIYEGGLRRGLQHERDALAEEARVALEGSLIQMRSDVRLSIEEVRRQERALVQARLAADSARSALDLTVEAYRAGATNDLDVSTAQQQSRDADITAVVAEDGVRQARLDLVTALGQFP